MYIVYIMCNIECEYYEQYRLGNIVLIKPHLV